MYGIGSSLGAALGGVMADALGWRWEFGVQVPLLIVSLVISVFAIPEGLGIQHHGDDMWKALHLFDYRGSILLTAANVSFVLGLVRSPSPFSSVPFWKTNCGLEQSLGGNVLPCKCSLYYASLDHRLGMMRLNITLGSHPIVLASLVIFAVCFPTFIWVESWVHRPIMPLYLIKNSPRANLIFSNSIASILSNGIVFNM